MTTWVRLSFLPVVWLLGLIAGCELVVAVDGLDNGQCPAEQKACDNRCVPKSDPTTGCALSSCAPCVVPNATAICDDAGRCAVATCIGSYEDCDDNRPGCETDLAHDPDHCGGCTASPCETANGVPGCSAKICATGGCNAGHDDCNRDPKDGCETSLQTDTDCGVCRHACAPGTACVQGICT